MKRQTSSARIAQPLDQIAALALLGLHEQIDQPFGPWLPRRLCKSERLSRHD